MPCSGSVSRTETWVRAVDSGEVPSGCCLQILPDLHKHFSSRLDLRASLCVNEQTPGCSWGVTPGLSLIFTLIGHWSLDGFSL